MKESEAKETLSQYRVTALIIIAVCMLVESSFLCLIEHQLADFWICGYAIDLFFFLALFFLMEFERKRAHISDNTETTFLRISAGFGICTLLTGAYFFLPDFYCPFLILPVILYALSNSVITLTACLYFPAIFCIMTGAGTIELTLYILLVLLGTVWVRALEYEVYHLWGCLLMAIATLFLPIIFEYMSVRQLYPTHGLYSLAAAIIIFILCFFFYRKVRNDTLVEISNRLEDILSDDYSAVIELKNYSRIEFTHALLVSKLCFQYAKKLGLRSDLCAAAGFYYRIGKWKGEPHVSNGVDEGKRLSFPPDLILILSEYYGEEALPSTAESALVHIVDATIKKMQALKSSAAESTWNRELLIYQTLNEFSQSGIYDKSGLSMNQFLTIRDLLVKEELLNEFLS